MSNEGVSNAAGKGRRWPGPDSWLAGETGRTDPGSEAWSLMHWLMVSNKRRLVNTGGEFDLAPQQMIALRMLGSGPRKMSELAQALFCDNSNVTGIVDRLEERGLVRREAAEGDRRVKLLVLTEEGEFMRSEITKRMAEPPPAIASLSEKDQRALRDILQRALESAPDADLPEVAAPTGAGSPGR
ncbi:MAG TPA: MarR family transcriptional regulator [Solirubrobacterales bacterium]|nr:MarR family transcriptional regulator [Solirubrobacterales bacterium]